MFQATRGALPLKQSGLRASDHRNRGASDLSLKKAAASGPAEESHHDDHDLFLAAAIMAQPILLVGILIGGLIEDRRAR